MTQTVNIADYLFQRLRQLGVGSIFGVPGDYNLLLLDHVEPSGLKWVGNCNELNAAYAADGYAKINGLGALITTFGVGELSAVNGIAGAYAEKAPVVHIVGTPSRAMQDSRALMHHTFADGEYRRFAAMHKHVTVAQTNLTDPRTALQQIDWILEQALLYSRPVYLEIPDDIVGISVALSDSIPSAITSVRPVSSHSETQALECALGRIYAAQRPLILVDGESRPCGILDQINNLVQETGWPTWTTIFGKGLVNEQMENVHGFYAGLYGDAPSKAYFESADLVFHLGPHVSDTNSLGFSTLPNLAITISLSETLVQVGAEKFRDLSSQQFMQKLLQRLDTGRLTKVVGPPRAVKAIGVTHPGDKITQAGFYLFVNHLFRSGDIILTETGTASHGGRDFRLPPDVRMFSAITWLSIGYMLPATLGAALAQREIQQNAIPSVKSRVVLFIGDGSLQMTVQELSTMISQKINAIIFIINNDGYTIERAIHGRNQGYNGIASWGHRHALSLFGEEEERAKKNYSSARNWGELSSAVKQLPEGDGIRIVEVFMERDDCQGILLDLMNKQAAPESEETAPEIIG